MILFFFFFFKNKRYLLNFLLVDQRIHCPRSRTSRYSSRPISNPVNSNSPTVAAFLEKVGVFNLRGLFDITTLGVVRAACFLAGIVEASLSDTRDRHW